MRAESVDAEIERMVEKRRDGPPVTRGHQALCERLYWRYLAWGVAGFDEEAEAFYTEGGRVRALPD